MAPSSADAPSASSSGAAGVAAVLCREHGDFWVAGHYQIACHKVYGPLLLGAGAPEFEFVCPICLQTPLRLAHGEAGPRGSLRCTRCTRTFASNATFADLTVSSGIKQEVYSQRQWQVRKATWGCSFARGLLGGRGRGLGGSFGGRLPACLACHMREREWPPGFQ